MSYLSGNPTRFDKPILLSKHSALPPIIMDIQLLLNNILPPLSSPHKRCIRFLKHHLNRPMEQNQSFIEQPIDFPSIKYYFTFSRIIQSNNGSGYYSRQNLDRHVNALIIPTDKYYTHFGFDILYLIFCGTLQ